MRKRRVWGGGNSYVRACRQETSNPSSESSPGGPVHTRDLSERLGFFGAIGYWKILSTRKRLNCEETKNSQPGFGKNAGVPVFAHHAKKHPHRFAVVRVQAARKQERDRCYRKGKLGKKYPPRLTSKVADQVTCNGGACRRYVCKLRTTRNSPSCRRILHKELADPELREGTIVAGGEMVAHGWNS